MGEILPKVKINDTELYYTKHGSGTPFLIMHGGLGLFIFEKCGHNPFMEARDKFFKVIRDWFKRAYQK